MGRKPWAKPALVAGLVMALAAPIAVSGAADHLDSPAVSGRSDIDINDLYVFEGSNPSNTVLAMTVSPLAGASTRFGDKDSVGYQFRIDNTGDAIEDITYQIDFIDLDGGSQKAQIRRVEGVKAQRLEPAGRVVASGATGSTLSIKDGGKAFTGLRSDPFFFDLSGFRGTVEGIGDDALGNMPTDFFAQLNTLAVVLEVPDADLGSNIAVWATTSAPNSSGAWVQADRKGRPAINTVVNSSGPLVQAPVGNKQLFNAGKPRNDAVFTDAVIHALQVFSSLDSEGSYAYDQAAALAGVLLPDVVTYNTATAAAGPLNGRALADDVIDIELRIVTGGDPLGLFADRDADGGVNGDGVGPHTDYLSSFPYLGVPHS
jgi:hypothetical protein